MSVQKSKKKRKSKPKLSSDELRKKLKVKHIETKKKLTKKYPHADKFFKSKNLDPGKIRDQSARIIGAGMLTGSLLLSSPTSTKALPLPDELLDNLKESETASNLKNSPELMVNIFKSTLPSEIRPLTRNEEKTLEQVFKQVLGVKAKATLEGEHLNTSFGRIGAEQHLRRYPGDTLDQHSPENGTYGSDRPQEMLKEGIAPGLGAWGYFAPTKEKLSDDLIEKERWYAVVQTLYLPDWNTRQPHLKNWYKYRKVLVVNTENGKAVVAAIADSGPAAWTGKHFGGSPEVMDYLGGPRYKKGPVIIFFVDDPDNKVPLGPVTYGE